MPKIYCSLTIDAEPDCDAHWKRSNPLALKSVVYGIPKILRPIWSKFNINPVYFLSPEVLERDECCEVLRKEKELGAEIGAHLHPEYINPQKKYQRYEGTVAGEYACYAYNREIEFEKIKNLTESITRKIGERPVSYRAGRFGADIDSINSLARLGYKVDSSITPRINWSKGHGPDFKDYPDQPYFVDLNNFQREDRNSRILEVPITIGNKRLFFLPEKWFFYKWLRPTLMTNREMKSLVKRYIKKYENQEYLVFCMMFHSMEIIPKATPYTRTWAGSRFFINRLEKIVRCLKELNCRFQSLSEIYDIYQKGNGEF